MTNETEGRTYNNCHWELKSRIMRFPEFPRDYVLVETPHIVLNGKWVMEGLLRQNSTWSWLIGISPDELEDFQFTDKNGVLRVLYISDKPFGYIVAEEDDVDKTVFPPTVKPTGRKRLVCARQVHRGELGRSVHIPTVNYVRQPFEDGQKPNVTKARERRRGQYGWVELADLGEMTVGYSPDKWVELVLEYWQFSGHLHYENGQRVGTLVDTMWGSGLDIELGTAEFKSMTPGQFREEVGYDSSELWIRRGFAYTILRLIALGVRPVVAQPA